MHRLRALLEIAGGGLVLARVDLVDVGTAIGLVGGLAGLWALVLSFRTANTVKGFVEAQQTEIDDQGDEIEAIKRDGG